MHVSTYSGHAVGVGQIQLGRILVGGVEHGAVIARGRRADRRGFDDQELPPEAVIAPSEDAVSIGAAMAMRAAARAEARAVLALFDALVDLLTGGADRD